MRSMNRCPIPARLWPSWTKWKMLVTRYCLSLKPWLKSEQERNAQTWIRKVRSNHSRRQDWCLPENSHSPRRTGDSFSFLKSRPTKTNPLKALKSKPTERSVKLRLDLRSKRRRPVNYRVGLFVRVPGRIGEFPRQLTCRSCSTLSLAQRLCERVAEQLLWNQHIGCPPT